MEFYSGFPQFIKGDRREGRDIKFRHNTGDRDSKTYSEAADYFRFRERTVSSPPIEPAFIMRFRDRGHVVANELGIQHVDRESGAVGRTVIMCAGISDQSTAGAVKYLIANWSALSDEFDKDDFVIFLNYESWGGYSSSGNLAPIKPPETARDIKLDWVKRRNHDTYRIRIAGD